MHLWGGVDKILCVGLNLTHSRRELHLSSTALKLYTTEQNPPESATPGTA